MAFNSWLNLAGLLEAYLRGGLLKKFPSEEEAYSRGLFKRAGSIKLLW